MTIDNVEYIGQYHTYVTGEVFTQPTFVDGKEKLIPFVDFSKIGETDDIGMDFFKNFEYDNITKLDVLDTLIPNGIEEITEEDLTNGFLKDTLGINTMVDV